MFVSGSSNGVNSGSYAQFVVSDSTYVFPLHPRLSFAQGASLGVPFFTAYKESFHEFHRAEKMH